MISRGRLSTISVRPMAERSAPNFDRQYPDVKTTVSGVPGVSSALENTRPSIGCTPSIGNTPSVTNSVAHFLGLREAGDAHGAGVPEPDILEGPAFLAIGEILKRRGAGAWQVDAGRGVVERDELVGARIRQRLQEHAFDDAEDRRIGADADRERQHRDARKERHPREAPQDLVQSHSEYIRRDIGVQQSGAPKEVVVFVTRLPTGDSVLHKVSSLAVRRALRIDRDTVPVVEQAGRGAGQHRHPS